MVGIKKKSFVEDLTDMTEKLDEKHPGVLETMGYGLLVIGGLAFSWIFTRNCIASGIRRAR